MITLAMMTVAPLGTARRAGRRRNAPASGFTLIELLMTITIAGIIAMIAIPSFRYITNSNRIASEINGLLGDLQFARAEGIVPAPYLARAHWVSLTGFDILSAAELARRLRQSYDLVVARLPRARRPAVSVAHGK